MSSKQDKGPETVDALIAEVAAKHGTLLTPDDPMLIVGTVFEFQFGRAMTKLEQFTQKFTDDIAGSNSVYVEESKEIAERLITKFGPWVQDQARDVMGEVKTEAVKMIRFEQEFVRAIADRTVKAAWVGWISCFLSIGAAIIALTTLVVVLK
jgi:hypothetical protein